MRNMIFVFATISITCFSDQSDAAYKICKSAEQEKHIKAADLSGPVNKQFLDAARHHNIKAIFRYFDWQNIESGRACPNKGESNFKWKIKETIRENPSRLANKS